jgi:hypothetical protein
MSNGLYSGVSGLALGTGLYRNAASLWGNASGLDAGFGGWSPLSLFASGEQGVWYDPSDFSTMFQDDAGTTPVTATGQTVGLILDKSGRGNHATQANLGRRPILQQDAGGRYFLLFDGSDDSLVSSTITPGTNKAQVFAGVRKLSDVAAGIVAETSLSSATNNGTIGLLAPQAATASVGFNSRGTVVRGAVYTNAAVTAPVTTVLSGICEISTDTALLRLNGTQVTQNIGDQGTGNYLAYPLYIGRRGGTTIPFNGRLYSLIVRFGSNLDAGTITNAETWVNGKTGAY